KPNWTDSMAIPMSHAATSPAPPPSAAPCTRAITGFGHFAMAKNIRPTARASSRFFSYEYCTIRFIQFRSAPAQNDFPLARRTITRTSSRWANSVNASVIRSTNSSLNALWMSGLSSSTDATCLLISISNMYLHPEDTKPRFFTRCIHGRRYSERKYHARIRRIDNAIIPQPGRTVICVPLFCVFIKDRLHKFPLLVRRQGFALGFELVDFHLKQYIGRLLATHYRNPRVWPHPELSWAISPAAHSIISGAVRSADNYCKLRDGSIRNCIDHFGAVFRNSALFELLSHHKSCNVLEKHQRDIALCAKFDEMCRFQSAL